MEATLTKPVIDMHYVMSVINESYDKLLKVKPYYLEAVLKVKNMLKVSFNSRLRTKAGVCKFSRIGKTLVSVSIELSLDYISKVSIEQINDTITHELAHAIQAMDCGDSNHGIIWASIHRSMGGSGKQFCTGEVKRNKMKQYKVKDLVTGMLYKMSARRFNKYKNIEHGNYGKRFIVENVD